MRHWTAAVLISCLGLVTSGCGGCSDASGSGWDIDDGTPDASAEVGPDTGVADAESRPDTRPEIDLGVLPSCGDGQVDDGEACDGAELDGQSCADFGFSGGELRCMDSCSGFLVGDCTGVPTWTPTMASPCEACGADELCIDGQCVAECSGTALENISQLDTDVRTHQVSATVTIDGRPIDEWAAGSGLGEVIFEPSRGYPTRRLDVDANGRISGEVLEGQYQVYWDGDLGRPALPLLVGAEVEVDRDRSLELNAPAPQPATIELVAPEWFGAFSARMMLEPASEDSRFSVPIDLDEALEHRADIFFSGPMQIKVENIQSSDIGTAVEPYRSSVRQTWVHGPITTPPDDAIELPLRQLNLHLLNPDAEGSGDVPEGYGMRFELKPGHSPPSAPFREVGRADVDFGQSTMVPVLAGDYWLGWNHPGDQGWRHIQVSEDSDETIEAAVQFVTVTIDLDGLPTDEATKMWVSARHESLGLVPTGAPLEPTGQLELTLPAGTTDFRVALSNDSEDLGSWRAYDVMIGNGQTVFAPEFEPAETLTVRGEVLRRGQTMPDNTWSRSNSDSDDVGGRARIKFECVDDCFGGGQGESLGSAGPAVYEAELEAGVYRVRVVTPGGSDWNLPTPEDVLPPPGYILHPRLEIRESMRRDFDIRMDRVDVRLTEDGATLSPLSSWASANTGESSRGRIGIQRTPVPEFSHYPFVPFSSDMGVEGDAEATFYVYPGHYGVSGSLTDAGTLRRKVTIDGDREISFDVSLAHIDGQLTWNGGPWTGQGYHDSGLYFHTDRRGARLVPDDDGTFSRTVFAKPTDVTWERRERYSHVGVTGQFSLFDGCR